MQVSPNITTRPRAFTFVLTLQKRGKNTILVLAAVETRRMCSRSTPPEEDDHNCGLKEHGRFLGQETVPPKPYRWRDTFQRAGKSLRCSTRYG
ncbi:hypothetical protein VUR80DRAFT_5796 [Thermomyces stellatus]